MTRGSLPLASALVIGVFAAAALVCLGWWLTYEPATDLVLYLPGLDGKPEAAAGDAVEIIRIGEGFTRFDRFDEGPPAGEASWPRFRGPRFDNINTEPVELIDSWGGEEPTILWSADLGEGHAAPVVHNGRVYLMDYDERQKADMLRCFSLADGHELWRRWYHLKVKRNHGMSRTIPAVGDGYVVTIGPRCHVMCVRADNGELLWGFDLVEDFGAEVPLWYTGQCPMIDEGVAVIAVGGESLLIGVDCETGNVLWRTPNPRGWKMSHSSVAPMKLAGVKQYLYCAEGGVVGVAADGDNRGRMLWQTSEWSPKVCAPSPVVFEDGRIFVTAGYGAGSMMLRVTEQNGSFAVQSLYSLEPEDGMACEQQTPLLYQGHLFGILPKDAGGLRGRFVCYHPDGRVVWASAKTERFGLGPFLIADGKFLILDDRGVLTLADAGAGEFRILDRARILAGRDAWGPMALADGRLLARDSKTMVCVDLRAGQDG